MLNLNPGVDETPPTPTPNPTAQEKIRKKIGTVPKIVFGAALLLVIPMLGNTFAGSITVRNVGGKVEFGQGIAEAVVCDADGVTITPTGGYRSGLFVLETITVGDLNLTSSGCAGRTLQIYIVDTATALATWITGTTSAGLRFETPTAGAGSEIPVSFASNFVASATTGGTTSETMTIVSSGGWIPSNAVSRFIIQSS
jgi:hypothetical protein